MMREWRAFWTMADAEAALRYQRADEESAMHVEHAREAERSGDERRAERHWLCAVRALLWWGLR